MCQPYRIIAAPAAQATRLFASDLARSRAFYGDLLGFEVEDVPGSMFYFVTGRVGIWFLTHPQTTPGDRFSEFRVGLDPLAFTAPDEAALRALADRLLAAGVPTQGVETFAPTGNLYVAFRDPDNIQRNYPGQRITN